MEKTSNYYYPQLDAIRGLSFLAVFFYHAWHPDFGTAFAAQLLAFFYKSLDFSIDVFFVLSSFLLTRLGINEHKRNGNFSFRKYFIRRALRIWPLYYAIMIFSFVLIPIASKYTGVSVTLPPAQWYLFFISNFYIPEHVYFLRFLWTLSVEEQFYLALGLSLYLFRKHLKIITGVFLVASIAFNIYGVVNDAPVYFNTLTYLFDFAVGALTALAINRNIPVIAYLRNFGAKKSLLLYISLPFLLLTGFLVERLFTGIAADLVTVATRLLFVIYTGTVIAEQMVNSNTVFKAGKSKFLIYTGKLSYGLYCFHGIVLTFGSIALQKMNLAWNPFVTAVIFLIADYAIAALSYRFLEKPFLKMKDRLRRI